MHFLLTSTRNGVLMTSSVYWLLFPATSSTWVNWLLLATIYTTSPIIVACIFDEGCYAWHIIESMSSCENILEWDDCLCIWPATDSAELMSSTLLTESQKQSFWYQLYLSHTYITETIVHILNSDLLYGRFDFSEQRFRWATADRFVHRWTEVWLTSWCRCNQLQYNSTVCRYNLI